jgi:signal transduction histidine kinase
MSAVDTTQNNKEITIESLTAQIAETEARFQKVIAEQEKVATLLIRRDLELSRANDKLRALDTAKSDFISIAAHQLRTPLSAIKWILHMTLHGDFMDENERQQFIQKAYESTDRMITLVNDLLEVDHIQSGKDHIVFKSVDIQTILHPIIFDMAPQAEKRHLTITHNLAASSIVKGDSEKLRAIFQNLIENAVKYTLEGGNVVINSAVMGKFLNVSIKDTGIGIPDDQKEQVFKKFFRAQNAVKMETVGSGLGLFIAKQIIERHGGKIWFESKQGEGTTFYITLPLAV